MFIKAAINGGRSYEENAAVPITPAEIAAASVAAVAAGADIVHAHARTADGGQTIHPDDIARMIEAIRAEEATTIVGTTTGLWTCSGHVERMHLLESWRDDLLPDFASVAFCEEGAAEAAELVIDRGMVLESAVWSMDDVPALLAASTLHQNVRILIEPEDEDIDVAIAHAREMSRVIREAGVTAPILYHGYDQTAWPLVLAALEDGVQTRVGFEDMLVLDDGSVAPDNVAMVKLARQLESTFLTQIVTN